MAIHSIVRPFPHFHAPGSRRILLDAAPQRRLTLLGEATVYLRQRRAHWKSAAIAVSVASAWLGVCAVVFSHLG